MKALVQRGANIHEKDPSDISLLMHAAKMGRVDVIQSLIDHGANINAIKQKRMIDNYPNYTPIMFAAKFGNWDAVQFMATNGANPNSPERGQYSMPLQSAIKAGRLDVVQSLVKHGASLKGSANGRMIPLVEAIHVRNQEIVECLLNNGADVNVRDHNEDAPLIHAIKSKHAGIVNRLIKHGADVNATLYGQERGQTALMIAAENGLSEIVQTLVENGADVNARWYGGKSALWLAAENQHFKAAQYLANNGADANVTNYGSPLLWMLMREKQYAFAKYLIEHGADLSVQDEEGKNILMQASAEGRLDIVKFLLDMGAAINATNNQNSTPLMYAADGNHLDVVKYLLENGADVSHTNIYGRHAVDLTYNSEIKQYLTNAGIHNHSKKAPAQSIDSKMNIDQLSTIVIDATIPGAVDVPLRGHRYKVFIDDKSDKRVEGIAKIGRLITFIPNAERGQTAIVDITHVHERWAAGDLVEVLSSVELPPKSPRATFVPTSTSIAPDLVVGAEMDVLILEDSRMNPGRESFAKVDGLVVVVDGVSAIGERVHVRIIDRRERIAFAKPTGKPPSAPNQTKINCPRCNNNAEKAPTCSLCGGVGHIWIEN